MRARYAREIREGILLARDCIARRRRWPALIMGDVRNHVNPPLWQKAFVREVNAAVRDGRIRPPRGASGVSP